jgi:hypothetical protein
VKLRIKGPSLRLRLTQAEVRALADAGQVQEAVPFGAGVNLTYRLSRDANATRIGATFEGGVLEIRIPEATARQWCASNEVTLAALQESAPQPLRITVEKDFACLAPRTDEDESDNFPHPESGAKVC